VVGYTQFSTGDAVLAAGMLGDGAGETGFVERIKRSARIQP
jgi:hypothetical protein